MKNKMRVVVCILTDEPHSDRVSKIYGCFEHELFDINVYNVRPSVLEDDLQKILKKGSSNYSENLFKYRFNWCLHDTDKNNKEDYLLIVRDDVISSTDTNALAASIKEAINYNNSDKNQWDILYLSGWGDDCSKYSKVMDVPGYNMYISNTKGPKGSSAFLISPEYRTQMINRQSAKNKNYKTKSMIVIPVPFTVDPSFNNIDLSKINLQINKSDDIGKLSVQKEESSSTSKSALSFAWFIFIVVIAMIIVFLLIKYSR